jgi:chromate transporter
MNELHPQGTPGEVFQAFLKLGLTSFGGPVAHIGYFRDEFVTRRKWLDERAYVDIVALCQFLPGPASSQVGLSIGLSRAGYLGALSAWIGFTLPSAVALVCFAYGIAHFGGAANSGWLHGLKVAAVAVVALAVLGMARTLAPDRLRASLAVGAAAVAMIFPSSFGQIAAIVLGGIVGMALLRTEIDRNQVALPLSISRGVALSASALFITLLVGVPLLAAAADSHLLRFFDAFYRSGALVFGGGHVVLPLLQAAVVSPGWVGNDAFLAGYGAAQAVPGPLFTFAAYLGTVADPWPNGWFGAALATVAIFLPSFLLIFAVLPFWSAVRHQPTAQAALRGINAAVVGLLLAAFYDPVWKAGILSGADWVLAMAAFLLLFLWKAPPWLVVILSAIAGGLLPMLT